MKFAMLTRLAVLTATAVFVCNHAAHAETLDNIRQTKKVRIGIDLGVPPYGMVDDKVQPTGLDVEVARMLAQDLGAELVLVPTVGATRIPNLQTSKADLIVSTLSITPERAKVIDFSVPYTPIQTIVAAPKSMNIKSMADLAGKTVKTSRGTGMDMQLTREAKGATIVRYEDDATLATAAVTGQADIIGTTNSAMYAINQKKPPQLFEQKFVMSNFLAAVGVRKDEPQLLAWVNNWVKTNLKNGRLNTIFKKYFDQDLPEEILAGGK
jgi:polar amino acid transport system substrate-binding protein